MNVRAVATSVFGFIVLAMVSALISANVRKLADKHGRDNFLVRWTEKSRWERLRGLWWLWSIFGLSGGIALTLWVIPFLPGSPLTALKARLDIANRDRIAARQDATQAREELAAVQRNAAMTQTARNPQRPAILDETAHLPSNDKERLSDAFYELSKLFENADKLTYAAKYQLDPRASANVTAAILGDPAKFTTMIVDMSRNAQLLEDDLARVLDKYNYYSRQLLYVVGPNSANDSMIERNALQDFLIYINKWNAIANKNDHTVTELLRYPQVEFAQSIKFASWLKGCEERLRNIKGAIQ
jgi:hypothetical protein